MNSEWLQHILKQNHIHSDLVYPGLDFEDFTNENSNRENIVGGLFHKRHKTKRHQDVIEVARRCGAKCLMLNRDISGPSKENLREFYNKIKVWVSSSELEGLHNCPMEAALCGCAVVCTNHSRGGVADYAEHKITALVYPSQNMDKATEYTDKMLKDEDFRCQINQKMVKRLHKKIGDRKTNMTRFMEVVSE